MTSLTVYKASAGSGKTFTLATEYIKLLVKNPNNYKNILAVTFTNKATEEMKTRILSQLYGLWQRQPESADYMKVLTESLGVTPEHVSKQAGIALHSLIHDYSFFRVQTIDTFLQTVMRNLARELDLLSNYKVSLNTKQVINIAVDNMIDRLRKQDKELRWIIGFMEQSISEDKSWNVVGTIKGFAEHVKDDPYRVGKKDLSEKLDDDNFFKEYTRKLREIRDNAKSIMKAYADRFVEMLSEAGIAAEELIKKTVISNYFKKLSQGELRAEKVLNSTITSCLDDAEAWVTKTNKRREYIISVVENRLQPHLIATEEARKKQYLLYQTAVTTLANIDALRLLGSIDKEIDLINDKNNTRLLNDTPHLLNDIIGDSDAPFIYEKIGASINHVMMDEFQDTSRIQWKNFKVLLRETMSRTKSGNLIVGDVKQSIYRWRSGDWRLLNNIEKEFAEPPTIMNLQTNYRSERNIIDFNNAFFRIAADRVFHDEETKNIEDAWQIKTAYSDVEQSAREGKEPAGLVRVTLLPGDERGKEKHFDDNMSAAIEQQVDELLAAGIEQDDIAILVRRNRDIEFVADYFMQHRPEIAIVSDTAFRLDASSAVNIIIQAMRTLTRPDNPIEEATLSAYYRRMQGDESLVTDADNLPLPEEYVNEREQLLKLPLPELTERLYQIFVASDISGEDAYISAFFDCVNDFVSDLLGDVSTFLDAWDDEYYKKTIPAGKANGIRMTTIYKSKGLEYDNVIIPFCSWELENTHKQPTLWVSTEEQPFGDLSLIPVRYDKKLYATAYGKYAIEEHTQSMVDNLNLLYVAFTRAKKNLFVIGQLGGGENNRSQLIENVLPLLSQTLSGASYTDNVFTYGTLKSGDKSAKHKGESTTTNPFNTVLTPINVPMTTYGTAAETRQSRKAREFIVGDEETRSDSRRRLGIILHNLFARIETEDDIPRAIDELKNEGLLYDTDLTPEQVSTAIDKGLADPIVKDWFSGRYRIFRECSIVYTDDSGRPQTRRPDRVMTDGDNYIVVDFKSGSPRREHHEQVAQYISLISSMGLGARAEGANTVGARATTRVRPYSRPSDVKGYLWYFLDNKIVEI